MISDDNDPADLAGFRARREERRLEQKRKKLIENAYQPNCGREIPPRINPDTEDVVKKIRNCYDATKGHLTCLEDEFGRLVDSELIDPEAGRGLQDDCRRPYEVLYENPWAPSAPGTASIRTSSPTAPSTARRSSCTSSRRCSTTSANWPTPAVLAPRRTTTCSGTSSVRTGSPMTSTRAPSRPRVDWLSDGGDFHTHFYGDGRVIVTMIDLQLSREAIDAIWPHDNDLCGDGPICLHPRGTICYIEPVEPTERFSHQKIKIDISSVLEGYADAMAAGVNLGQPTEEGTSR